MAVETKIVAVLQQYCGRGASHSFAAIPTIASSTGPANRVGERLMTFSTLARGGLLLQRLRKVARLACTSSNSRTFSIAITAWSAKVCTSSI